MQQITSYAAAAAATAFGCGVPASLYAQQWKQIYEQRSGNVEAVEGILALGSQRDDVEIEFNYLASKWKSDRNSSSSTTEIATHPAYQQIIGLGKPAIPLILRELKKETDHWFWALKAITREDPVPAGSRGRMQEMSAIWIEWGRKNGYVR